MSQEIRISKELEERLSRASALTRKSRSTIVKEAVSHYCSMLISEHGETWHDVLLAGGFQPVKTRIRKLSTDKERLQKVISTRAKKRSR